jgi:2-pyrone-4,6-dicarboxylate lactonase
MNAFETDPDWLRFHANPSRPAFELPKGSVDAHCHVFGPGAVFPFAAQRRYTPCDAPKEALWKIRDFLGFDRNVIVQATCHGSDNRAVLDALRDANGRARGVATVELPVSDSELRELHEAGIRGVRFNFVKRLADSVPRETLMEIARRIRPLGWHTVIYFEAADLPELFDFFAALPTIVVIDHMGRPDVTKPVDGPDFGLFLKLMREHQNFWSKVTCPERLSGRGAPDYADVIPFARRVVEEFPDRVLWGTDWPHPNMKSHMPDDGQLVDLIPHIATSAPRQRLLLVENPQRLYWDR